jgi:sugar transferase (PEP-CTERM/EpsH1 system associated)
MSKPALLFLAHRIPFPPNKGDKIRSFHLLRHLAETHRIWLGTFVDDPADHAGVEPLKAWCEQVFVRPLSPRRAKLRSLKGLLTGQPLTVPYYQDAAMQSWVDRVIDEHDIQRVLVFSGAMAQYVMGERHRRLRRVVDFVDVDSAKWSQYAEQHRWPMSWLYRREGTRLLCFERRVAAACDASVFVSPAEAELFRGLAPRQAARVLSAANGVDLDYYDPHGDYPQPYDAGEAPLVFTGAMDYWPNIDAVRWFASEVFPKVLEAVPSARFHIVGGGAGATVTELAQAPGVSVEGRVPDVRPWIRHAAAVVAPLRVARGVQNKVLEGLAMARPTVVTPAALEGIAAVPGESVLLAEDADSLARAVVQVLSAERDAEDLGRAGRQLMESCYRWADNMETVAQALIGHASADSSGPDLKRGTSA